ncbi:hypothetical protein AB4Y34_38940 [Paraburkholderia sp. BR10954]
MWLPLRSFSLQRFQPRPFGLKTIPQPVRRPAAEHPDEIVRMHQQVAAANRVYNKHVAAAQKVFDEKKAAAKKERDAAIAAAHHGVGQ